MYGAFLLIKRCQIAIFVGTKYCLKDAPYVNEYYERDTGLKKGKPLRLLSEEFKEWRVHFIKGDLCHMVNRIQYEANRFQFE